MPHYDDMVTEQKRISRAFGAVAGVALPIIGGLFTSMILGDPLIGVAIAGAITICLGAYGKRNAQNTIEEGFWTGVMWGGGLTSIASSAYIGAGQAGWIETRFTP